MDLYNQPKSKYELPLPDARIYYIPHFLLETEANLFFNSLLEDLTWEQHYIKIFGKKVAQPRLTALLAINDLPYTYSGLTLSPKPFPASLESLHAKLEKHTGHSFSHCLANLYRDGKDSMGWHADDERELGKEPVIASLSFGGVRNFQLQHKTRKDLKYKIDLGHGSLLLMQGSTQEFYKHQLPKTSKPVTARINLTFRKILNLV